MIDYIKLARQAGIDVLEQESERASMWQGLAQVRETFMRASLKPPTTLLLESHDEGMRFLSAIRQQDLWVAPAGSDRLGKPIEMADGSVWMECQVMGIAVRWPANRIATPDGGWSYA
jgi:NAD(P)-dependent dehydrogenase (short-subunit alcohol dehydrogenase family)